LSYDGTNYHGWQFQPELPTVQGALSDAITAICGEPRRLTGCGRTDAGVHALTYCANFETDATIPADRLPYALNSRLPRDISVSAAADVPPDFNAILSCNRKEYVYKLYSGDVHDPFRHSYAYFYPRALDLDAIRRAAAHFVGTHDFAAVRSVGTVTRTSVRTVFHFDITQDADTTTFAVCADGFLYNMARALVGTLLYVSEGKIDADAIPALLESRNRTLAGPTMPPCGLYLNRVWY
jgi:tRNA pseudouridine38-40 synthase